MPTVQIRDVPESTFELLKKSAEKNNRSINQEALTLIQDELDRWKKDPESYGAKHLRQTHLYQSEADAFTSSRISIDPDEAKASRIRKRERILKDLHDNNPFANIVDLPPILELLHEDRR